MYTLMVRQAYTREVYTMQDKVGAVTAWRIYPKVGVDIKDAMRRLGKIL